MIAYDEALKRVLAHARPLPPMRVALREALGRHLAQDVVARESIPRFDQSAVDGFGVRAADLKGATAARPARLAVIGEVRAGSPNVIASSHSAFRTPHSALGFPHSALRTPHSAFAFRIFTGAPIPRGVDAVVMKEFCEEGGGEVLIKQAAAPGANIRPKGGEFQKGKRVLAAGTRVTPPVVGLLATLGCARPAVHRKPRVALIVTGDELRAPGERLKAGQIHDANSPALTAALDAPGIELVASVLVGDDRRAIRRALAAALTKAHVVITVGGVSVGDYDFVKEVAAGLGVEEIYWKVALKPGMPNYFGVLARGRGGRTRPRLVFGLPGNPVSALVSFHLLVRPALLKMAGALDPEPQLLNATLTAKLKKMHGRLEWVRGVLAAKGDSGLIATPTLGQESHMLGGLAAADCLIEFPADFTLLARGSAVRVVPLAWEGA